MTTATVRWRALILSLVVTIPTMFGPVVPAEGATLSQLRFATGPIRAREWTPIQVWSDTRTPSRVPGAALQIERSEDGIEWMQWGVLPTFSWASGLAPFVVGPTATIAPVGEVTIPTGIAITLFTKISAVPDQAYHYRLVESRQLLSFVDTGHGDNAEPFSVLPTDRLLPRPTKPYVRWIRRLRCSGCSVDVRTSSGWVSWNGSTPIPGTTFRVRERARVYFYPVIPNS